MKNKRPPKSKDKKYEINQCALFKVTTKKRLASILGVDTGTLSRLSIDERNYNVFEIAEEKCEFTGKIVKARLVQNPVPELKDIHRRIHDLLSRVVAPDYCFGGAKGRSYRSNAAAHTDSVAAATFDLKSFFPSTKSAQIFGFFKDKLLCAPDVAGILTDLCTYKGALATGSPASPQLAFWANLPLFEVLETIAHRYNLILSVYVDDITMSGPRVPAQLQHQVNEVVQKYGHKLSPGKTKIFRRGNPKHITGVVVHNGFLRVPNSRMKKARAISEALTRTSATDLTQREHLASKLSGLLGEAAHIDSRYRPWAQRSYRDLRFLQRLANVPPIAF